MKKTIMYLLIILSTPIYAQNWSLVNSGATDAIKDMFFQNENTGFAVAGQGKILKTTDGGQNWNLIYENSELYQEQSIVVTNDKVICFGLSFTGVIKKLEFSINTNDFQITNFSNPWTPSNPITFNNTIYDGGHVYVGNQFVPLVSVPIVLGFDVSSGASDIYNNGNNITASDNYFIYYSNSGVNWNTVQFHPGFLNSEPYQSFWDGTSKMRTVTNYPCVVHISNDNGFSWTFNQTNVQALYFYFIDAEKVLGLYLFSELSPQNKIYYSTDSGINFDFETVANPVKKIYKYNNNLIFAYGGNGVIYKSTNAGGLLDIIDIKIKEININLYPNPTKNGEINISYNKDEIQINALSIVNSLGAEIKILRDNFGIISTSSFSDGVYFLKFDTNKGVITKKIILKN
jgi:hypothetical protein